MTRRDQGCELLCEEVRETLSGMLESEPRSCEEEAAARHLEHCTECAEFMAELEALDRNLREHVDQTVDSDRIWARVTAAIACEPAPGGAASSRLERPEGRRNFLRFGVAAAVVLAAPIGGLIWSRATSRRQPFLAGVVEDFMDFLQGGGILDVRASHPQVVRRWMKARVEFELPPSVSGPEGVQLAGARLCSILGRKLAVSGLSLRFPEYGPVCDARFWIGVFGVGPCIRDVARWRTHDGDLAARWSGLRDCLRRTPERTRTLHRAFQKNRSLTMWSVPLPTNPCRRSESGTPQGGVISPILSESSDNNGYGNLTILGT